MGRQKPGKPRRQRKPQKYTLRQLQPPGEPYDEWFNVRPGNGYRSDPQITAEAVALMDCINRIGPLYAWDVPKAALYLDRLIDTGSLPIFQGESEGTLVPIEEMAAAQGGASPDQIRESIHNLHAAGALLVFTDPEHDISYVRMVAKRPQEPGAPWQFAGDPDLVASTVCLPDHMWQELPVDVAAAVGFMRACQAQLEKPDPAVYGTHKGVNGTEHARQLFDEAKASGFVDYKGCDACPTGHLCTRSE